MLIGQRWAKYEPHALDELAQHAGERRRRVLAQVRLDHLDQIADQLDEALLQALLRLARDRPEIGAVGRCRRLTAAASRATTATRLVRGRHRDETTGARVVTWWDRWRRRGGASTTVAATTTGDRRPRRGWNRSLAATPTAAGRANRHRLCRRCVASRRDAGRSHTHRCIRSGAQCRAQCEHGVRVAE